VRVSFHPQLAVRQEERFIVFLELEEKLKLGSTLAFDMLDVRYREEVETRKKIWTFQGLIPGCT